MVTLGGFTSRAKTGIYTFCVVSAEVSSFLLFNVHCVSLFLSTWNCVLLPYNSYFPNKHFDLDKRHFHDDSEPNSTGTSNFMYSASQAFSSLIHTKFHQCCIKTCEGCATGGGSNRSYCLLLSCVSLCVDVQSPRDMIGEAEPVVKFN